LFGEAPEESVLINRFDREAVNGAGRYGHEGVGQEYVAVSPRWRPASALARPRRAMALALWIRLWSVMVTA